jgi:FG-GAP repeat
MGRRRRRDDARATASPVSRRLLRRPRTLVALATAIIAFGVFSSAVGTGALPTASLPPFGATNGEGSLSTVAELGDVNGDGFGDYAVGLPSADVAGSADAGIVYVFLGHAGALPPTPTALNLAAASFRINGHAGEMLGYTVVGNDVNNDNRADVVIGAPMAGPPSKTGGGAVYVIFGTPNPQDVSTTALSFTGYTNGPNPVPPSPLGSRYDGFMVDSHTGMALAALPDVNGDGYRDIAVGAPDAALHRPGGGGVAVLYGKPQGVHMTLNDLWSDGYPYFFHVDFPTLDEQHIGASVASVGDMTGDGQPDIAIGAPQADPGGRANAGSVWIISARLPVIGPGCTGMNVDATCPWIRIDHLTAAQGYRIDGAQPGDGLGTSLAGIGDQNGDGIRDLAIGLAAASPNGRAGAGQVLVVPGQADSLTRDLAVTPPLQRIDGPVAGAGLGASLAAAGDADSDGRIDMLIGAPGEASSAGAAYLVRGVPNTTSDLALAPSKIAPAGAGAQTGSAVAAGFALDGAGADALVAAPGANGSGAWYLVGGSGTPILPPPGGSPPPPAPPAPPPPPAAPPATTTSGGTKATTTTGTTTGTTTTAKPAAKPVAKKKKKLPLCPLKKPKPKYKIVKGKRVKVKPAPCRPRPKSKAKATSS